MDDSGQQIAGLAPLGQPDFERQADPLPDAAKPLIGRRFNHGLNPANHNVSKDGDADDRYEDGEQYRRNTGYGCSSRRNQCGFHCCGFPLFYILNNFNYLCTISVDNGF